ncbi:MAG TPA: hypothetical protein P5230_00150 [Candidatus Magasanikbacteria bacterium]|nr:hypothetical protein [Candidatus Magasanikbacteria bacterium]
MNGKNILIIIGATALLGAGVYAGSEFIDWKAEHDKMAQDIADKNFWQDKQTEWEEDLARKNNKEEINWDEEGAQMMYELSDESALGKYLEIDWEKETDKMSDDLKIKLYSGVWEQIATYMNGELQADSAKATLVLSKDSYESKTSCVSTGGLKILDEVMAMTVKTNTCYAGMIGSTVDYSYELSKDAQILVLNYSQGDFSMREVFKRVKNK